MAELWFLILCVGLVFTVLHLFLRKWWAAAFSLVGVAGAVLYFIGVYH